LPDIAALRLKAKEFEDKLKELSDKDKELSEKANGCNELMRK
jgi:hypothetical protein